MRTDADHNFSVWILWTSLMKIVLRGGFCGGQCLITVQLPWHWHRHARQCRARAVNGMGMIIRCILHLQWGSHTQPAPGCCSASCHALVAEREPLETWTVTDSDNADRQYIMAARSAHFCTPSLESTSGCYCRCTARRTDQVLVVWLFPVLGLGLGSRTTDNSLVTQVSSVTKTPSG